MTAVSRSAWRPARRARVDGPQPPATPPPTEVLKPFVAKAPQEMQPFLSSSSSQHTAARLQISEMTTQLHSSTAFGTKATIREQVVQHVLKEARAKGSRVALPPVYEVGSSRNTCASVAGTGPLAFIGPVTRSEGISVLRGALPESLAESSAAALRAVPEEFWKVLTPDAEHLKALQNVQTRQGVQPAAKMQLKRMRYSRLCESYGGVDRQTIAKHVGAALKLQAHERIIMNFARYEAGDYLESHTDRPSGNAAYERQRAWVWHLSARGWDAARGGEFVDEQTDTRFVPTYNSLVHFRVPRWHRVEPVAPDASEARYTAYGWVITPEVRALSTLEELAQLRQECGGALGSAAVVGWFGERVESSQARSYAVELAATCFNRAGISRLRGEDTRFAIATTVQVANALGLASSSSTTTERAHAARASHDACVGVVHWGRGHVDLVHLPVAGGAAALGVFVDEYSGRREAGANDSEAKVEHIIDSLTADLLSKHGIK